MLSLITVSRDNPEELLKTVSSVERQSVRPTTYVIVDSSSQGIQPRMRALAKRADADYVWVPPEGVYAAMRYSLTLVPDGSWVWWLNSSDWLAGTDSVKRVSEVLADVEPKQNTHWVVGELLRVQKGAPSAHQIGSSGEEFTRLLRWGQTGFPHPSTIFRKKSLVSVDPFGDRMMIAADYATSLRFAKAFGPPTISGSTLAVHDPNGLTSLHPLRNLFEKSLARIKTGGVAGVLAEVMVFPFSLLRSVWVRVNGEPRVAPVNNRQSSAP